MAKKISSRKYATRKQKKVFIKKIKDAVNGKKPLGKPLHGKFLSLLIKETVLNGSKKDD